MTATSVPSTLIAGDTWAFTLSFGDYQAPTWGASIYLENAASTVNATASDSGSDHAFSIAAATTAAVKSGRYKWSVRVNDGTTYKTVLEGWVNVKANPAAEGSSDPRSDTRKMLDALNATLLGRASSDQLAMTINGRSISRTPLEELIKWRDQLRAEVRTEEGGSSAGNGRRIGARFSRG